MTVPTFDGRGHDKLPTLTAYRTLIARIRSNIDTLLPAPSEYQATPPAKPVRTLGRAWRQSVEPLLDSIEPVFDQLAASVNSIQLDTSRTVDYQDTARVTSVARAQTSVQRIGGEIEAAVSALLAKSQRLAIPVRPQPQDATQEARLAGIKSDLQMLTRNTKDSADFTEKLQARLVAAAAANDALSVWLLCSDWVTEILAPSIGGMYPAEVCARWDAVVASVLADGDDDMRVALRLYRDLSDPQSGLPVLIVATGSFLTGVVDDLADYVVRNASA